MRDAGLKYRRNVAAVIVDADGSVLVGRKKATSHFVHFPQGGVGKKETFEEALWREIEEEVGLQRDGLRIVARLAGLSYDYRRKNRKREKWEGQEQTYYLIRCANGRPGVGCGSSDEFGVLEWLPYQSLSPDLFVSFKRGVVGKVLQTFFPLGMNNLDSHLETLDAQNRYHFNVESSLSAISPYDRALFVGGKQEALAQMKDLQKRIVDSQRKLNKQRVLVIIYDANVQTERRRINCLRRVGSLFDPILTSVRNPSDIGAVTEHGGLLLPALVQSVPAAQETLLLAESVYSIASQLDDEQLEYIADFERILLADGVMVLKFFLHITAEQWADCGAEAAASLQAAERVLRATASPVNWCIVPAEKKWYRDYVIASVVAQSLENVISD